MADQAKVTSVEAIEAFRAKLIVYLTKARAAVEEGSSEVYRTRQWLQGEQRRHWEDQARLRRKKLEQAQDELSTSKMSQIQTASSSQQMAVRKAREAFQEAEVKLAMLKKWDRELENRAEPLLRQTNSLQHTLNNDMPKAIAHLAQVVKTLDAYASISAPARIEGSVSKTPDGGASGEAL
ncbi:MAG: hypothetical protein H7Y43_14380 [Akkermansiaceae bacterium]|nr:hypothetical protein [Verrucomicrobiales bacterium]